MEKRGERKHFSIFSLADFRAVPQLTEGLEEAMSGWSTKSYIGGVKIFFNFNEYILTKQFSWQKLIKISQIFSNYDGVPFGTLRE